MACYEKLFQMNSFVFLLHLNQFNLKEKENKKKKKLKKRKVGGKQRLINK